MTNRYAIKFAYLGKAYAGFQRQTPNIPTIEKEIFYALQEIPLVESISKARYSAAGRTDKGVNAVSQVIAFDSFRDKIYLEEINQFLPDDIYAWALAKVPHNFSARRNALQRTYCYYYPSHGEDFAIMKEGVSKFRGTHNFKKLSKRSDPYPNGDPKSSFKTIDFADIQFLKELDLYIFEFRSKSFLWKQVRKMVALLLDVGVKNYSLSMIDEALNPQSNKPHQGIRPAPAYGLVLQNVKYSNISFKSLQKKFLIENNLQKYRQKYRTLTIILKEMEQNLF
ncbi:MAG: tRNA pseudouridine(38-40) synthase TruA [Asgard group archaeon]|nr:tRNA pseudouridine(38-40) synthase TruA [Asgard group archaeon]